MLEKTLGEKNGRRASLVGGNGGAQRGSDVALDDLAQGDERRHRRHGAVQVHGRLRTCRRADGEAIGVRDMAQMKRCMSGALEGSQGEQQGEGDCERAPTVREIGEKRQRARGQSDSRRRMRSHRSGCAGQQCSHAVFSQRGTRRDPERGFAISIVTWMSAGGACET